MRNNLSSSALSGAGFLDPINADTREPLDYDFALHAVSSETLDVANMESKPSRSPISSPVMAKAVRCRGMQIQNHQK